MRHFDSEVEPTRVRITCVVGLKIRLLRVCLSLGLRLGCGCSLTPVAGVLTIWPAWRLCKARVCARHASVPQLAGG